MMAPTPEVPHAGLMFRGFAVLAAVVLAASALWLAGEQHKQNCIDSKMANCSVLPWKSGEAVAKKKDKDWRDQSGWGDEGGWDEAP